jgi:hypothetical protein
VPARRIRNDGLRGSSPVARLIFGDSAVMSSSSASSSRAASESSSDATSSIGCCRRSR